jgi:hypothetical protein
MGDRVAPRTPAPVFLFLTILFSTLTLGGCATVRYERGAVLAGDELTETLFLSGEEFRLERESQQGILVFTGLFDVENSEWRFAVESLRAADGRLRTFTPALLYIYRGRSFQNGIAFYALLSPRTSPPDVVFIRAPCDFDIVR